MRVLQHHTGKATQRGAALMVMLVILVLGALTFLVNSLSTARLQVERDKITAASLAQAKEALIGHAASVDLASGSSRPGDLPCPDTNNDGVEELNCGNAVGSTGQSRRLGRLPWKTLGLPDLRDGSGERLWYAVSNNFKYSTHTTCTASGQPGCLSSDTVGTITLFASDGSKLNDGGASSGAVAVIIAPGEVLQRTDKATAQDRSSAGINIASNYLDIATVGGNTEDNATFVDGSPTDGFIQGRIKDNNGNVILNDQLLVITQDTIMHAIQKRVAGEVRQCLSEYAINAQNKGRYPWAVPQTNLTNYQDTSNQLIGRIPDTPFTNSCLDSGGHASGHGTNNCNSNPTLSMKNSWTGNCNINSSSGWWLNWKEIVFYGLADAYKPVNPPSTPITCPTCLTVNPPSATADKRFVVIVAGKKLAGQARTSIAEKSTLSNYLEAPNSGGTTAFAQGASSTTFNDTVVFQ